MRDPYQRSELPSPLLVSALRHAGFVIGTAAWRIRFTGRENIPQGDSRGLIIAANHQTYLDPYWICLPVYKPLRFMAWDRSFNWPLVGRLIRKLGAFPVNIEKGSVGSMKESLKVLGEGATLVVFPEGSRTGPDGRLLEFKQGAARMALTADVPVLPVTIRGGNKVWPMGRKYPGPGRVEIIYHPAIEAGDYLAGESIRHRAEALTDELKRVIGSAL